MDHFAGLDVSVKETSGQTIAKQRLSALCSRLNRSTQHSLNA